MPINKASDNLKLYFFYSFFLINFCIIIQIKLENEKKLLKKPHFNILKTIWYNNFLWLNTEKTINRKKETGWKD